MNRSLFSWIPSLCILFSPLAVAVPKGAVVKQTSLKPTSEFTSTHPAKSKRIQAGEGRASFRCAGFGGYEVEFEIFAVRSGINLRYEGSTVDLLEQTFDACPGENPEKANDVVQWRGFRKGNVFLPYALIYRLYSTNPQRVKVRHNTLVVIKLDGQNSRVVGNVSGSRSDGNTAAEALADELCAPEIVGGGGEVTRGESRAAAEREEPPVSRPEVVRSPGGTLVRFPNGQKFTLASTRGVLGPSTHPGSQEPFVGPGGWLVAVNEAPATKTSLVRLYLRDKSGRFSEIKNANEKVFRIVHSRELPKNPEFLRVERIDVAWDGKLWIALQTQNPQTGEWGEDAVVVGRTGVIESRFRGE
jgi:hypothetical protein